MKKLSLSLVAAVFCITLGRSAQAQLVTAWGAWGGEYTGSLFKTMSKL